MKIRAIRLRGVGTFADGVALEGLSGGLDVLAGPNELGKSTIFKGLDAAFRRPHSSGGKWLEALRSRGGGDMAVEADFEAGGASWRILKRFGRGGTAELTSLDTGRIEARKQDAEERLAELIGMRPDELGRFGLLWVEQERSLQPADPDAGGKDRGERSALMQAVEREVEAVAGGSRARKVRRRVTQELDQLTTPKNRERAKTGSPYALALKRRDDVAAKLAAAQQSARETAARRDELTALRERLALLAAPAAREARATRLRQAEAAFARAGKALADLKLARASRDAKSREHEQARSELAGFDRKLQDIAELQAASEESKGKLGALEASLAQAASARDKAREELLRLEGDERRLAAGAAAIRARLARARLDTARAIDAANRAAEQAIAGNRLSASELKSLESEEREIALIEARLSAAAPKLRIALASGATGRVRIAGNPVGDRAEIEVLHPVTLDIEGVGSISVLPGRDDGASDDRLDLAAHRDELASRLSRLGISSLDEARAKASRRADAERTLAEGKARLVGVAPKGIAALEAEVAREWAAIADRVDAEPSRQAATAEDIADAEARLEECRHGLAAARKRAGEAENALGLARTAVERLKATLEAGAARLTVLEAALPPPAARREERTRLAEKLDFVARETGDVERALAAAVEAAPAQAALAALEAERTAAERDKRQADDEINTLERSAARLEGALEEADEAGIGVAVEQLAGDLTRAETEVSAFAGRVAALALLLEMLTEAETAARDRFLAPVTARLAPFLAKVFPDAKLIFGAGFSPLALERAGVGEEIGSLSNGTQEQIAVLVRCAFGRLLAEAGTPAPLILDDALVYSDDRRIELMFAALELAARSHQVLMLTCRERTFERLAGHRLHLTPWRDA